MVRLLVLVAILASAQAIRVRIDGEDDPQKEEPQVEEPQTDERSLLTRRSPGLEFSQTESDKACYVEMKHESSKGACIKGESYGCVKGDKKVDKAKMWVDKGCKASFECNKSDGMSCESKGINHFTYEECYCG